ncbi:MAG: triose-phosphate isomerase [Bacteroidaceae bacterium]|nr:triose-phosphate isomerase [Prevotella sp.]MBP3824099.1 triose-phosphate isomerase [Bacteroidaceae bacterium]
MKRIAVNIARLVLAATLVFSGFVKAVDPMGTQYKIADYLEALHLGAFVPDFMALGVSILLSAFEFGLGICLLFAIQRRVVSGLTLLVMSIMTPLTLWLALTNPVSDCGCFGDAVTLTNWQTFGKNVVLLALAAFVWKWPLEMLRFISRSNQWIVINYSAIFILVVSGWSLYSLPYFDFRPYHVGTDLRKGWQQMMEGHESPYADFFIERMDNGEDITEQTLSAPGYVFLLVAPYLEQADDSNLDLINEISAYAEDEDIPFYCLTSSGTKGIEQWQDATGAEYPFCLTDGTTLKTIIRSNPGLVLLHNGVIIRKWSHNMLPTEHDLHGRLEHLDIGKLPEDSVPQKILTIFLWYVLPLLVLSIADRFWAWTRWVKKRKTNKLFKYLKKKTTMRKKIVAGNWKMNLNLQEGVALAKELNEALKAEKPNCGVVICTPFIHLASVAQVIDQEVIGLGAENCADKEKGAFTGEVSAEMVKSTGAQYVILGHSERREYYKETPEILKEKVLLALKNGLKVIFCIGETLAEREANQQNEVVKAELEGSVFNLSEADFRNIVIAYEPIWAIGTGKTATAEQAEEIHAYIRSIIAAKYGQAVADDTSILYGGSCKASNAPELFAKPDIDGGLIGGASLKCADFKGIIDAWK